MEQTIPKCQYLIRKGEEPLPGRANIFPWTEELAKRVKDFEAFEGELPALSEKQMAMRGEPVLSNRGHNPPAPTPAPKSDRGIVRTIQDDEPPWGGNAPQEDKPFTDNDRYKIVLDAMDQLTEEDIGATGKPKVRALQAKSGQKCNMKECELLWKLHNLNKKKEVNHE